MKIEGFSKREMIIIRILYHVLACSSLTSLKRGPDKVSEKEEARKKKNAMGGQGIVGWLVGSLARLVGEVEYT